MNRHKSHSAAGRFELERQQSFAGIPDPDQFSGDLVKIRRGLFFQLRDEVDELFGVQPLLSGPRFFRKKRFDNFKNQTGGFQPLLQLFPSCCLASQSLPVGLIDRRDEEIGVERTRKNGRAGQEKPLDEKFGETERGGAKNSGHCQAGTVPADVVDDMEKIADFRIRKKFLRPGDLARDPPSEERFAEEGEGFSTPKKNRCLLQLLLRKGERREGFGDEGGLGPFFLFGGTFFTSGGDKDEFSGARFPLRCHRGVRKRGFPLTEEGGEDFVERCDKFWSEPERFGQNDDLSLIPFDLLRGFPEEGDIGAAEPVDRLPGIADDEEAVYLRPVDFLEDIPLHRVGVLKFVDEDVEVAFGDFLGDLGTGGEKGERELFQIVEGEEGRCDPARPLCLRKGPDGFEKRLFLRSEAGDC